MERGMNSCSWFSVSDYESSSSNTDFLRWIKSSGAAPEAAHHQQTIPFLPVGGGGSSIYLDQVTSCYGGGGGFLFTDSQRKELERQATIYKCMISSVPVPHHLLFPLDSPVSSTYGGRYSRKGDLEPGRCKRTDGKKWRCSREVAPLQKYCDRHLHRGRPRSRKPVELNKKTRLHQNKTPPSTASAIEDPLPPKTDLLTISTPYHKETTNRDLDSKQAWKNPMESDYRSSLDHHFTAQPLNLLSYPNFPTDSRSSGDLSPSLNLSMAMAVGEVLDEQMRNIQTEAIWWEPPTGREEGRSARHFSRELQLRRPGPASSTGLCSRTPTAACAIALLWRRKSQTNGIFSMNRFCKVLINHFTTPNDYCELILPLSGRELFGGRFHRPQFQTLVPNSEGQFCNFLDLVF